MLGALVACVALVVQPALVPLRHVRHPHVLMGPLPGAVAELLDPGVTEASVVPLWREFRRCYPSEKAAIAAAKRNSAVILPFINTPDNIRFCYQVLGELDFDDDEILDIITKNPGVLGNKPGQLARSSQGEIRFSMALVTALDGLPEPIRMAIPPITAVTLVVVIAKRITECAGGICG